jgi:hypothetical protein
MSSSSTSVIQPTGLVHGHGECRYLDETIPVLSHILALELVDRRDGEATMKHPNTGWKLILHEGGPEVKDKPERNHYGVRVSNNQEVDNAYQYLLAEKEKLGLKKVVKRKERDGSYSMFFVEPGGNYWEIESYENRHKAGLPEHVAYPWKTRLTEKDFPGRGYVPQAMTHGTIECINLDASVKFYREALGLDVITHVPTIRPPRHQTSLYSLVRGQPRDPGKEPQVSHGAAAPYPDGGIAVRPCRRPQRIADPV